MYTTSAISKSPTECTYLIFIVCLLLFRHYIPSLVVPNRIEPWTKRTDSGYDKIAN
jgi:hypothetical protein